MDETKDRRSFFERFKHFSEIATIHGLYRVGHSTGWIRRVGWGLLFISLLTLVTVLTASSLMQHFSYPILTEVNKETTSSMKFPSLTICHANNYRLSAFRALSEGFDSYLSQLITSTIQKSLKSQNITGLEESDVTFALDSVYLNSTVIKMVSSTVDSMKWKFEKWCTFSMMDECKFPQDFTDYYYHSTVGFCKTFNFHGKYTQIAPGLPFGLSIKLFIDQWDKVPLLRDNVAGILLMIHPQDVYPNPFAEAVLVPTGYETHISMRKLLFHRQKKPYKANCTNGDGVFLIYPGRYTVINCQYSCFVKNLMEKCGLVESAYQFHSPKEFSESLKRFSARNMSATEMKKCILETMQNLKGTQDECICPAACFEESFNTKVSYSQWPNPSNIHYYRTMFANLTNRENMTADDVYKSVISLKVYFDELGQQVIRERPVSKWTDLFSKVGGHFGLWLGASIFSLMEMIGFTIKSIICLFKKKVYPDRENPIKIKVKMRE